MPTERTYKFYTLGCKLNFAESSHIGKELQTLGFRLAKADEEPALCVVNTCSVTDQADRKCRQLIHRISREYPATYLVVTGCYAQLKPQEVAAMPGVDLVLGANDKPALIALLQQAPELRCSHVSDTRLRVPYFGACSADDRTRHFLKVQDGCDCFCTYCTIPMARGRSRNGSIASLVEAAQQVAAQGGKEIILTGVNIGDFGKSTGETCLQLLQALDEVEGILRFRVSSIEPDLLTDEMIRFIARSQRFSPHFHIPLQAGCDATLQLMHRRYDTALFAHKIQYIREWMPEAFIGVDVIVGTRGETEAFYAQSEAFIQALPVSQLHVFSYSERAGTYALRIQPVVPPAEKKRRSEILLALSHAKLHAFYQAQIGQSRTVLWEAANRKGYMHGFTENYVKLSRPYCKAWVGRTEQVVIGSEMLCYE